MLFLNSNKNVIWYVMYDNSHVTFAEFTKILELSFAAIKKSCVMCCNAFSGQNSKFV
jgi:hypothetical protein